MLESLSIENFAIIDWVSIDFSSGMTVLSGETGAGKSIIIDALALLCGGRGSVDFIRKGADRLRIRGLFSLDDQQALRDFLKTIPIEITNEEDLLLIERELQSSGKNIVRINRQLVNVSTLKQLGQYLVDIHGQNEHQALLDSNSHLKLLDRYAKDTQSDLLLEYQAAFERYHVHRKSLLESHQDESQQQQRLQFLEFQLQEIEDLDLHGGEYEYLFQQTRRLAAAQEISQLVGGINLLMTDQEGAVDQLLDQVYQSLKSLEKYTPEFKGLSDQLRSTQLDLQEMARTIALKGDFPDFDSQEIDRLQERLSQLEQVQKKYALSIDELITYRDQIAEEIYQIKHREAYLVRIQSEFEAAYQEALKLAQELSSQRQRISHSLEAAIEQELKELYMPQARFEVKFKLLDSDETLAKAGYPSSYQLLNNTGMDQVEFYVATNVGEESKPLIKVASGGELSRLMLALKAIFARGQEVGSLVFDEIDTGVSGRVATAIAHKMKEIARYKQVLCISHLAQVAASGDQQLMIRKLVASERTITQVEPLSLDQRVEVISHMIAGNKDTPAALDLAQEMLQSYQNE
ncbi:DNA repair protein RecN [Facklamia sp. HMSC062C11]|uniref:DNA repair protein RecN n=1 Tax=Facklamia hominis TaxID=178214 RepID=A0AAJ1V3W6_9LACT|nr:MULTISPECIES: DNA repair protein RecN [Facklamia]MDK7187881.1 DNA repair protein RecN [Facklamia hominis]OFL66195.1 DNA repair protein RecN [Facklamia sp. HMSC062C11]